MAFPGILLLALAATFTVALAEEPKCGERNGWKQVAAEDNDLSRLTLLGKYSRLRADDVIDLDEGFGTEHDAPQSCCNYECSMNFTSYVAVGTDYGADDDCSWVSDCETSVSGYVYRHYRQGSATGTQIQGTCPVSFFSANLDGTSCKKVVQCFQNSGNVVAWKQCMGVFSSRSDPRDSPMKFNFGDTLVYRLKELQYAKSLQFVPKGRFSDWEIYTLRPDGKFDVIMA